MFSKIKFNKNKQTYEVYVYTDTKHKKCFSYKISRYGSLIDKVVKLSAEKCERINDYYEIFGNETVIYVYTKAYGIKKVYIDTEDLERIKQFKISISKDNHAKTFYASTKENKLHRIITNAPIGTVIDHINRNGLDNVKSNLRIVNMSLNNRNANIRIDNKTGFKGVTDMGNRYRVFWYSSPNVKCSKSFSKKKYGAETALSMAITFRKNKEKENNYIA